MTTQNNYKESMESIHTRPQWIPSQMAMESSAMYGFLERIFSQKKISKKNWDDLYAWSIKDTNDFWWELNEFVGVRWQREPRVAFVPGPTMRACEWFPDGRLNFAENLLPNPDDKVVLVAVAEGVERCEWTGLRLWNDVARCAMSLKAKGVCPGDRVAGVLINGAEAVICMLATASLGAVWSSCSPDFGAQGIKDRLVQISPKVVFSTVSYRYGGKLISNLDQTIMALKGMEPSPHIVPVDHFNRGSDGFARFCGHPGTVETSSLTIHFEPRRFEDPQYIMFSSGTTGLPKCIVHGVGGTLLQHKKELSLHSDLRSGDRLFFFTTCGWMMWNWMVSALSVGASIVTFDGSPTYCGVSHLWDICRDENVTHFGTSPKFLSVCAQDKGFSPSNNGEIPSLRSLLSTGSPLLPAHYHWVNEHLPKVHLASISGGTDIIGCFMLGNPLLPVLYGEIQAPGLGMAVECWDDNERPVVGVKGELVCVRPFVSMPICFWNDHKGELYRKAYFDNYPGKDVWRHGDFIEFTKAGGIIVHGRSDSTLNPGGVRIGTAEIYRAVEALSFVVDSLAIGQDLGDDIRVVLFVKLALGTVWSTDLEQNIRSVIRTNLTPRHVPQKVIPVKDIPYTRSGKKVELAVAKIMRGEPVSNRQSLANPDSLDEYEHLKIQLQV